MRNRRVGTGIFADFGQLKSYNRLQNNMTFKEAKELKEKIGEKHMMDGNEYDILVVPRDESERSNYFTQERSFETTDESALKYSSDFEVNGILWLDNNVVFIRYLKSNRTEL